MLSPPEHFQGKENVRLHVPQEDTTQNQKSFMSVDLIGRSLVFIQSEPITVKTGVLDAAYNLILHQIYYQFLL